MAKRCGRSGGLAARAGSAPTRPRGACTTAAPNEILRGGRTLRVTEGTRPGAAAGPRTPVPRARCSRRSPATGASCRSRRLFQTFSSKRHETSARTRASPTGRRDDQICISFVFAIRLTLPPAPPLLLQRARSERRQRRSGARPRGARGSRDDAALRPPERCRPQSRRASARTPKAGIACTLHASSPRCPKGAPLRCFQWRFAGRKGQQMGNGARVDRFYA